MVKASLKICSQCGVQFHSSKDLCINCRDEVIYENSSFFDKPKIEMSEEELFETIKAKLQEDEQKNFKILNVIFDLSKTLSSEFIVEALYAKLESDIEDGEIDDHLIMDAKITLDMLSRMCLNCFFGGFC